MSIITDELERMEAQKSIGSGLEWAKFKKLINALIESNKKKQSKILKLRKAAVYRAKVNKDLKC